MSKGRFTAYLFLSMFVHMGLLLGIDTFFRSASKPTSINLVPVETFTLEEEHPPLEPKLTICEQIPTREALETKSQRLRRTTAHLQADHTVPPVPKRASLEPRLIIDQASLLHASHTDWARDIEVLETKSQISVGTEARIKVHDLAGPIPKEGNFEPSLNLDSVPTLGVLPTGREGKEVPSKPIISTFQMPPLRLSPVQPSRSDELRPLEIEMPKALVKAETGGVQPYSQTQKKIEAPIGRSRVRADFVSELPPIPTVRSPSMPEQREMVLAVSDDLLTNRLARPERKMKFQLIRKLDPRLAQKKECAMAPRPVIPKEEPATPDLNSGVSFPVPGSEEGASFLFVLDTSGSVKGAPLEEIKQSAREFVGLMGPNDRAGIMTFNDTTELIRPLTSEKRPLRREIGNVRTKGTQTLLFDALMVAVRMIQREYCESKFLILFSDGKDEGSQSTLQEAIQSIQLTGVSILCVGYSRVERKYLDTLRTIASEADGVFADAPQFHDMVMLYKTARNTNVEIAKSESSHTRKPSGSNKMHDF